MIEIKYVLNGDTDLNGIVNGIDFGTLAANFNKGYSAWDQGDFEYQGFVNGIDFGDLAQNFNKGSNINPAPNYTIPAQYAATFTDSITTPLSDLSAQVDWGDGSAPVAGAIVSDGNGTFHVVANHAYANAGNYQVTTTITDSNSSTSTQATSNAIVANTLFSAEALDATDVQLTWAAQPILASGQTLQYSTDPTFATGVTSTTLAGGATNDTISDLSAGTTYYFELMPASTSFPIVATASATTNAVDDNNNSIGPTAPTISEAATSSQPSNTTLSLTMTATAPDGDPITYNWQEVSGPGGPPPQFTNSEQTTDVILSAAGTYDFRGTATDDSTGLSVSSDANATVDQVGTSISVLPGSLQLLPDEPQQFSATEQDQFGIPMQQQPSEINWQLSDQSSPGVVDANGLYEPYTLGWGAHAITTDDPTTYATPITVNAIDPDNDLIGSVTFGQRSDVIISPDTVPGYSNGNVYPYGTPPPPGTIINSQFPNMTFSGPGGQQVQADESYDYYMPDFFDVASSSSAQGLAIDFAEPVDFPSEALQMAFQDGDVGTNFGSVDVYSGGTLEGTDAIVGDLSDQYAMADVDLSSFQNVTRIQFNISQDPYTSAPTLVGLFMLQYARRKSRRSFWGTAVQVNCKRRISCRATAC